MTSEQQIFVCELCGGAHPTSEHSDTQNSESKRPEQNTELAHAIASLQDSALDKIEEAVIADGRSTNDIIRELDEAKQGNDYKLKSSLIESLRQRLDIAEIRGKEPQKDIIDTLKQVYAGDQYSEARQNVLTNEIPKNDPDLLVNAFTDPKFSKSDSILYSLNDGIRETIYGALKDKNAVKKTVILVSTTQDGATKIRLFEDLSAWLPRNSSEEAKREMDSYGGFTYLKKDLGYKLFKENLDVFYRLLKNGMISIEGLEEMIKEESDESLKDILLHVRTIGDAMTALKFMQSKDVILTTVPELENAGLPPELREAITNTAKRLAAAFDNPAKIRSLGYLRQREVSTSSSDIPNKFIVGLADGEDRATIAWSNTRDFMEHKHLARRIGGLPKQLCAGGTIELSKLEDGRTRVAFEGRSGAFGPYNQVFLERFRDAITEQLRDELETEVEVVIKKSET